MAAYRRLLSLTVRHDFYAAPDGCRLRFTPTVRAGAWLRRAGCLLRNDAAGLQVLHDGAAWPQDEGRVAVALDFLVHAEDPLVHNVTEGLQRSSNIVALYGAVPRFDHPPLPQGSDAEILQRSAELACPRPRAGAQAPWLAVTLRPLPTGAGRHCILPLAARRLVWKYLFVGDWPQQGLQVVDLAKANAVEFGPPQVEPLADGSSAVAIRSHSPIAIGERAGHKFELRGDAPRRGHDELLVARLPLADARQFVLEDVAGKPALVSEIFVHR